MASSSSAQTRGWEILFHGGCIRKVSDSRYVVKSSNASKWYVVCWRRGRWHCECAEHKNRPVACEHILAVLYLLRLPTVLLLNSDPEAFACPYHADASVIVSKGARHNKTGRVQVFMCKKCGRRFSSTLGFSKARHDPVVIVAAIDLHLKGLSTRQVQQHLEMIYGCDVTAMTVYNWVRRYTRLVADYAKQLRPGVGGHWHADEMSVRTKGSHAYLWNVLDRRTRFLLVSAFTRGRGEKEAKRILSKSLRLARKKPGRLVTDGLASYKRPVRSLKVRQHVSSPKFTDRTNNNLVERLHGTLRPRYDGLRALQGVRSGGHFADAMWLNYNFIRPHLALDGATPAEVAGIGTKARNKWHFLITAAHAKRKRRQKKKRKEDEKETGNRDSHTGTQE